MSSSDEELIIIAAAYYRKKQRSNSKRFWINPYFEKRLSCGSYNVMKDMEDEEKFRSFYRMKRETFQELVKLVGPAIKKKDTNYRRAVCVEERLLITLR